MPIGRTHGFLFFSVRLSQAMTKKQFVLSAFAAAIPAYLLIGSMVWSLFQGGMLTDTAKVSIALWVVFIVVALGGLVIGVLPFAVLIFPGLYPVAAAGTVPAVGGSQSGSSGKSSAADEDTEPGGLEDGGDSEFADEFSDEFSDDYEDTK
jgi:hypothetical protein